MDKKNTFRFLIIFACFFISGIGMAATITTTGSGNWSSTTPNAPWPGGVIPASGDIIIIGTGLTLTVDSNRTCNSIELSNNSVLTVNSSVVLTVTTTITQGNTLTSNISGTISGGGTINAGGALTVINADGNGNGLYNVILSTSITSLNVGSIVINSNLGNNSSRRRDGTLSIVSGTVSVIGGITTSNEVAANISTLTLANAPQSGTLRIGGATPFTLDATGTNTINLNGTASTVEYYFGGAQTVYATTYNNLTLSNSGAKTTTGVTVNGVLSMEGTATASALPTYGSAAALQYNTATARTISNTANNGIEWPTTFSGTGGVIIANTGKITMATAGRTIASGSKLTVNSGATFDPGALAHTISGGASLLINGTLDFSNASGEIRTGTSGTSTLTVGAGGLIKTIDAIGVGPAANASFSVQSGGAWSENIASAGTVEYYRSTDNTGVVTDRNYNNLTISTTGTKTWTLGATRTVAGTLTITAPLTLSGTQTINVGGNWVNNSGTFTAGTSTINFNGTTQSIGGTTSTTFYNAILANSGTKTLGTATTFSNNLSIVSGVIADLSNLLTHTASNTLTLGGFGTPSGSHGSTSSGATYKSNTYFAATSGIINVTNSSCTITAVLSVSGASTICNGGTANLIVTITNGASPFTVVYSGGTVGSYTTGSNIPVSPGSTTGYTLTSVTGANGCSTSGSGSPTVTVQSIPTAGSIGSAQTICNGGDPATFTSSTDGTGDGTITYRWESSVSPFSSWSTIGGASSSTYDAPSGLTITTQYRRITISTLNSVACESVPTSTVEVTVQSTPTAGAIATAQTICNSGDPGAFTSTTDGTGDGTITYRWESSVSPFSSWSTIGGATSATYDAPSGLMATTQYRRIAISTLNSVACESVPTSTIQVTVQSTPTAGAIAADQTICNGGDPAAFTSTTAGTGDGTITYRWESSVSPFSSWSTIGGATASTYDVPSGLTVTTRYRRIAISTLNSIACESAPTSTVQVTVQSVPTAGSIGSAETICNGGNPAAFTSTTDGTGDGTITYRWESSVSPFSSWSTIGGATASTYDVPSGLTATTQYRRITISTLNSTACESIATSPIQVTVNAAFTSGAIDTTGETICNGGTPASTIGNATPASGGDGSITYSWRSSADGYAADISGATSATYLPPAGLATTTSYRRYANDGTCNTSPTVSTGTWTVTVDAVSVGGTVSSDQTICYGTEMSDLTLSAYTGAIVKWQRSSDIAFTSPTDIAETSDTLAGATVGALFSNTYFRAVVQNGVCLVAYSTPAFISLDATTVGGTVSSDQTICYNTEPADLTLSGQTGSVIKWESALDAGFTSPTDILVTATTLTGATIGNLTQDTYFRAIVQNGSCDVEESSSILISVDAVSVGGTVSSDQTICYGTEMSNLTLSGYTGTIVKWQSSTDIAFTTPTDIGEILATLSGTTVGPLFSNTYFRAVVQNGVCSEAYSSSVLISIDAATVGGTVSSDQAICYNTQPADLTLSGQTGSVIKWESSLDAGFTSPTDILVTSTTLTGAIIGNLTQDTYFRAIVHNGSCGVQESSAVLISIDDVPVGGSVDGGTAICAGSTSGLLTLSGYSGTIIRWEYSVSPFTSWTTIANTTDTYTSSALTQTTQFRAVIGNGACPEVYSSAASVNINTVTWSSGAWSPTAPDATTAAVISSSYTSAGNNIDACSLTVNNGATVVISSGDTVTLSGALTAVSGSFVTFNNNANLIQSGTTNTNSGAIIIKRNSSRIYRLDYTLWSSPVANQNLKAFSPLTLDNRFYTYNTVTSVSPAIAANTYVSVPSPATTNFAAAKGYLIRSPNNWTAFVSTSTPGTIFPGSFTGVPNNGDYSYTLEDGGDGERFNLVGNPYPSPISAVDFIEDPNNTTTLTGALYFWRKTNNMATSPSYCIWTEGGFVGNDEAEVFDPLDIIQTGQGFFVEATGSGTANFTNAMRINDHANQFFKSSTVATTAVERNRIWLNATNSTGSFSQAMVGYMTNATQGVDNTIDGKYINDGDIALASLINNVQYAIQGRALPFDVNDVVPMSFKASNAGDYSIAIDHVDGLFTGGTQPIYLKDNVTNTVHDLNTGAYSFATTAGTFNDRFEITYTLPLGTTNPIFSANNVIIYNHNGGFVVNTGNVIMSSVKVFDIRGRLIEENANVNASQTTIKGGLANEVLLVQITSEDGITVTKKVIR